MQDKTNKYHQVDIIKEIVWTIILTVLLFAYWIALLLAITFVFNSMIKLSVQAIILISAFLTISWLLYRIIKGIVKEILLLNITCYITMQPCVV